MNKERIFRKLYESKCKREEYLGKLPSDLQLMFGNSTYISSLHQDLDIMMESIFGEHSYSVKWFLYEWQPGYKVGLSGEEETPIHNIDEMIDWMKKNEGFE